VDLHFPPADDAAWPTVDPESLGWRADALAEALTFAEVCRTDHLVVLQDGRLAVNATFGSEPADASDVFAVQKALFALLVGIARAERLVDVDDRLAKYLPAGWTRLPRADEERLTVRHVLTMTTGMNDALEADGEIGVTWHYNNTAYNYLKRILCERSGLDLQTLTKTWLTGRVGMHDTRWVDRDALLPDGRPFTGLLMSGLDMARLGLLLLADGSWDGEPLVSDAGFRAEMLEPGSDANPAWGFMWWRNDQARFMVPFVNRTFEGRPIPEAPSGLIMAQGAMDNRVYVDPQAGRVIVRRGRGAFRREERRNFDRELWQHLAPIWSPT
jgi:CubicO group peptidase (beta-lactamase class C family)